MKPAMCGSGGGPVLSSPATAHGPPGGGELLGNLEIIEDKSGARRKNGLPTRYHKGRFLGKGGFAKVYEVVDIESKEVFAAKIVAKSSISKPRAHAKLKSEIAIHKSLDHDKVVKFYDFFEDSESIYIILEVCPNQTLNEFMRKRPGKRLIEPEAMFFLYDLIVALKYLHRRRVIHRDLKLGNLFLDADVRIKVGDFGLAAQLEHENERRRTICGTPNYIAPEILEGKHGHSYEVDVWSLGVVLYTMLVGRPPFETSDVKTTYRRIRYNQYSFPENVRLSDQAKDLVAAILRTDPRSRPGLDDILASPWFQNSRLPPSMPVTISGYAASPRAGSGCSARSETPERGVADFARIDSPTPRFPLRDRSPGAPPQNVPPQVTHGLPRCQTPSLPMKPSPLGSYVPCNASATTPGRQATGGSERVPPRMPLQHRGNEENVMPGNAMYDNCMSGGHGPAAALSPIPNQTFGNGGTGGPLQRRSSGDPPHHHASYTPHSSVGSHALRPTSAQSHQPPPTSRESSPLVGNSVPARVVAHGYCSSRSATNSPRQTMHSSSRQAGLHVSATPTSSGATAKDRCSVRSLGSSTGSSASGIENGGRFAKTAPSVVRGTSAVFSGRRPTAIDSPKLAVAAAVATASVASTTASYASPLIASAVNSEENMRTPLHSERRSASATHKKERSSSSPALLLDEGINGVGDECLAATPAGASATQAIIPPECTSRGLLLSGRGAVAQTCAQSPAGEACFGMFLGTQVGGVGTPTGAASGSHQPHEVSPSALPELWVTRWVDYSSKYGVGYILSDGSIGVYFNDSTKILLSVEGEHFDYITRRTQEKPEQRTRHTFEDYPEDLKKKVTLLRHFRNYMLTDVLERRDGATVGESSLPAPPHDTAPRKSSSASTSDATFSHQAPYVKKWTRNRHAIMFQLSNKIVQVIFFDKTEAVLSSKAHMVTYVDKRGQSCSYPLSSVLDVPSPELAKRLRYIKDILVNLLGARTGEAPPGAAMTQ